MNNNFKFVLEDSSFKKAYLYGPIIACHYYTDLNKSSVIGRVGKLSSSGGTVCTVPISIADAKPTARKTKNSNFLLICLDFKVSHFYSFGFYFKLH